MSGARPKTSNGQILAVRIIGTEKDTLDPDDTLGRYGRVLRGPIGHILGKYGPDDDELAPEDAGLFQVWYRVEIA